MALTGFIEDEHGNEHAAAYGLCAPMVIQTYPPESASCRFDFTVWRDIYAMIAGKKPVFVASLNVTGESLFNFIVATEAQVLAGAGMIPAIVGQMQSVVKQDTRFSAWTDTA